MCNCTDFLIFQVIVSCILKMLNSRIIWFFFTVCYGIEIRIDETSGTRNDGMIEHGASFSVHCSAPEVKAGDVVVW